MTPTTPAEAAVVAAGFRRAFDGWCRSTMIDARTLSRCLDIDVPRLAALRRRELPTADELARIADAMEWPASRLAALVEQSREAKAWLTVSAA